MLHTYYSFKVVFRLYTFDGSSFDHFSGLMSVDQVVVSRLDLLVHPTFLTAFFLVAFDAPLWDLEPRLIRHGRELLVVT